MGKRKRGIYNSKAKESQRKDLRNSLTSAEAILWKCLQRRQLDGKKFRRQQSIGPYIVDFYCPECRVIVELDGTGHYEKDAVEYDLRRTEYLGEQGIRVIRFGNEAVCKKLESVLEEIRANLTSMTTPSAPSAQPPLLSEEGRPHSTS